MFKPERILVPTDFSEKGKQTSKLAVKQAIAIADEHDAELIFLHVITTEVEKKPLFFLDDDKFGELRKDLRANAKKALDAFAKKYIGERKIRYRVKVREGVAYNEILKEERESEVDLVTIATRGHIESTAHCCQTLHVHPRGFQTTVMMGLSFRLFHILSEVSGEIQHFNNTLVSRYPLIRKPCDSRI